MSSQTQGNQDKLEGDQPQAPAVHALGQPPASQPGMEVTIAAREAADIPAPVAQGPAPPQPLTFRRVCLELVTIPAFGIRLSTARQQLDCWEGFLSLAEKRFKTYVHASEVVLFVSTSLSVALLAGGHDHSAAYFLLTVQLSVESLFCSIGVTRMIKDIERKMIEHPLSVQQCGPLCVISFVVLFHTLAEIFFIVSITNMAWQSGSEVAKISCVVFDIQLVLICLVLHFSFQRPTIHNLSLAV